MNNGGTMNIDDLLQRADALVAEWYGTPVAAIIRDLAAKVREYDDVNERFKKRERENMEREFALEQRAERAERIAGECQAGYQTLECELAEARALLRQVRHHALFPRGLEDAIDAALRKETK